MCEGREGLIRSCGAFIRQKVPHESFLQECGVASIEGVHGSFNFCRTPRPVRDRAVPIRRVEDALPDSEYVAATRVRGASTVRRRYCEVIHMTSEEPAEHACGLPNKMSPS